MRNSKCIFFTIVILLFCVNISDQNEKKQMEKKSNIVNTTADLNFEFLKGSFWIFLYLFISLRLGICPEISLARVTNGHEIT